MVLGGYAVSIWLLARVVQILPVSVAYAVWSGVGTALVAVIGVVLLHEHMDVVRALGLTAIVVGVVLVNLHPAR
jgi:multidrug transporter EmrE-like cation transporter